MHRLGEHGFHRLHTRQRVAVALVLVVGYMIAEAVGGLLANSLALLADAGHMLSDAAALGLTLFALWVAQRPPTARHSFGYYRAEILAALVNGAALFVIAAVIFVEAYHRFGALPEIRSGFMLAVALGGLLTNVVCLWLLHPGRSENLNVHGAWLHVVADALGSIAAIAAALLIWVFDWTWADLTASILIAIAVLYSAWGIVKQAVAVLMEATPRHLDIDRIRSAMMSVAGVVAIHDLHVWTIGSGMDCLAAHAVVEEGCPYHSVLSDLRRTLSQQFGIDHVTLQLEPAGFEEIAAVC